MLTWGLRFFLRSARRESSGGCPLSSLLAGERGLESRDAESSECKAGFLWKLPRGLLSGSLPYSYSSLPSTRHPLCTSAKMTYIYFVLSQGCIFIYIFLYMLIHSELPTFLSLFLFCRSYYFIYIKTTKPKWFKKKKKKFKKREEKGRLGGSVG